jgi:pimeloyl-ACP methyl ester carboxylesterase
VGGNLALDLAAHHGDRFRAFISLNGWYSTGSFKGFNNDIFRHPQHSPDHYAALCLGATGPQAPEPFRQEIYWNYCSGVPGVYAGDNDYFAFGHDLREDGHLIDTDKTPVYLLAGEYDGTAHNQEFGGPAAARNIPGLKFHVMKGLSHFANTDNPMGFRKELLPVLDEILERERMTA